MLESKKDFDADASGKYKYWQAELEASMKARKKWWKLADGIVNRYVGDGDKQHRTEEFKLNLFHSNIKTLGDMLYGNTPKIDVSRRYAQADDDVGRVAAEMMERLLNLDMQDNGSDMDAVFRATLQDRLLSGLGCAKVRYDHDTAQQPVTGPDGQPMIDPATGQPVMEEIATNERAPVEYHYWGDVLWGWCRNWSTMPWIAFRSYTTKDQNEKRWGKNVAARIPMKTQTPNTSDEARENTDADSAWQKSEIWEIWCMETRTIHYICLGYDKQLEQKADFLKLKNFWPTPPFFLANPTTTLYTPTPDYKLAQDLYAEIDTLQSRIAIITEAVKVVGVYNASADNIKQMLSGSVDNDLIPVENWALFGENGGLAGQVDWLPIKDIAETLLLLINIRDQTIQLLQQTTGMTDVMRGSLDNQYEGVGQTEAKQKFGSVRIQALQEQFAVFASNLMQIKAEVIARHFSPQSIAQMANMEFSKDAELAMPAVELIKDPDTARLRIDIRPESVAMVDYQALKGERTEYLNALATFMQSATPLMEADPAAKPLVLQLLQWGLAGFKGASEIEGVLDKAIEAVQKQQAEGGDEKPDPDQLKAQADMQLAEIKLQGDLQKIQAKLQADTTTRQTDMQADIETMLQGHQAKLRELEAGMRAKIAETQAALQADLLMEQAQANSNIMQTQASVEGEIQKDIVEGQIDMEKEEQKTQAEIDKILTAASAEIETAAAKPNDKV